MNASLKIEEILNTKANQFIKTDLLNSYASEIRNSNPAESAEAADLALKFSAEQNYLKGKADALSNLGFFNMHNADHEKAFLLLMEAISLYVLTEDQKGLANAQYNLGTVHMRTGNFTHAIDFLHKSLDYREKTNDKAGMASCYFQISYINQHFNDLTAAETAAEKVLSLRTELNDESGMGAALMILGEIYLKRKEFEKAKETLKRSLDFREKAKENMGYFATLLRWAELHKELGEFDTAISYAEKGLQMATEGNVGFGIIRFLQMLGNIELKRKNSAGAKTQLLKALDFANKQNFKSIQYELHQAIVEIYKLEEDYKSAFEHFEKFHTIKEDVISLQSNTQLKSVQFINQIEFSRKEAELEKIKNAELNEANKIISEKNKEITDSINYAKRIQSAHLPTDKYIKKSLDRLKK